MKQLKLICILFFFSLFGTMVSRMENQRLVVNEWQLAFHNFIMNFLLSLMTSFFFFFYVSRVSGTMKTRCKLDLLDVYHFHLFCLQGKGFSFLFLFSPKRFLFSHKNAFIQRSCRIAKRHCWKWDYRHGKGLVRQVGTRLAGNQIEKMFRSGMILTFESYCCGILLSSSSRITGQLKNPTGRFRDNLLVSNIFQVACIKVRRWLLTYT